MIMTLLLCFLPIPDKQKTEVFDLGSPTALLSLER
jgi:hypothetical protein